MKILLHTCCGPCGIMPVEKLLEDGHQVTTYFYNPNIHPYQEYKRRKNTFRDYMATQPVDVVIEDDYALEDFLLHVANRVDTCCAYCYEARLQKAAIYAKEHGFDAFSTTLLVSIYQNHELIQQIGGQMGETYGIPFYDQDFRPFFREGQQKARDLDLYMQGYCGCIYSEKDRYCKKKKAKQSQS